MIILIPSYEPSDRLLHVLIELQQEGAHPDRVVVVDDGSGPAYDGWFHDAARLGAEVIRYDTNRGKGHALRTGFAHIEGVYPGEPVVCADSDGQHSPLDIRRVSARLADTDADVVLGSRLFTGAVPLRSRLGNTLTSKAFRLVTGQELLDTQTGLRAYPARMLPWLQTVTGDRFEYELRLLLQAAREHQHIEQLPIETIYLEQNASSHFRPVQDSMRIYRPLLVFAASSLTGFAIDAALLLLLVALGAPLVAAAVVARVVSASVNFALNRRFVFHADGGGGRGWQRVALRYSGLALLLLAANILLLEAIWHLTNHLVMAKVVTEVALFATSYLVQKGYVFSRNSSWARTDSSAASHTERGTSRYTSSTTSRGVRAP